MASAHWLGNALLLRAFRLFVFVVDFALVVFVVLYLFFVVFGVASCFCLLIIFDMNVFAYKK